MRLMEIQRLDLTSRMAPGFLNFHYVSLLQPRLRLDNLPSQSKYSSIFAWSKAIPGELAELARMFEPSLKLKQFRAGKPWTGAKLLYNL